MLQQADLEEKTHDLYLIPKGYAGQVRIVHEIENAPVPVTEGKYDVLRVNDRGYAITSLPQSKGYIDDLYYYVDKRGSVKRYQKAVFHMADQAVYREMVMNIRIPIFRLAVMRTWMIKELALGLRIFFMKRV
ncbi:hypothetical protein M5V91_19910 [Cytobacillus pseudoceanisediminis]|uniref:DUF6843 domain-containing protein n=1 Tax=Cytobacillus pseudoceanisediminis TaxID=3051614 RepID=UPI00218AA618|nr:hypothetical protein [Cytobacillus pseudoceanisediminis]UQX53129.1 hypothetical protein M5V91_19910 [Cytobacillus pseudoceanisediminis]